MDPLRMRCSQIRLVRGPRILSSRRDDLGGIGCHEGRDRSAQRGSDKDNVGRAGPDAGGQKFILVQNEERRFPETWLVIAWPRRKIREPSLQPFVQGRSPASILLVDDAFHHIHVDQVFPVGSESLEALQRIGDPRCLPLRPAVGDQRRRGHADPGKENDGVGAKRRRHPSVRRSPVKGGRQGRNPRPP